MADQPFIKGEYIDFNKDREYFTMQMRESGFDVKVENFRPYLINKDYIVKDLHAENIIKDTDGNYLFIDTVPSLNLENRQYGAGEVKNIF